MAEQKFHIGVEMLLRELNVNSVRMAKFGRVAVMASSHTVRQLSAISDLKPDFSDCPHHQAIPMCVLGRQIVHFKASKNRERRAENGPEAALGLGRLDEGDAAGYFGYVALHRPAKLYERNDGQIVFPAFDAANLTPSYTTSGDTILGLLLFPGQVGGNAGLPGVLADANSPRPREEPGQRLPKDAVLSAHWLEKATEQGLADAQFSLGNAYRDGLGVPLNPIEA